MGFNVAQPKRSSHPSKIRYFLSSPLSLFSLPSSCLFPTQKGCCPTTFSLERGKNDKKKFNLVSWKQVFQEQDRGGLSVRSPTFTNLAFRGKIVWRLITGPLAWWKWVLESKYLDFPRQQLLDSNIPNRDSSKIWRLCKKAIPMMTQNISKVPRGGSSLNIGADKILGQ